MPITFTQTHFHKQSGLGTNIFEIIMLFIGFSALFFFFSMADGDDIREYWLELMFIAFMAMGIFKSIFSKKPEPLQTDITLTDDELALTGVHCNIPLSTLHFDTYHQANALERYHLWDEEGTLALFSVEEDALSTALGDLRDNGAIQGDHYSVEHSSGQGGSVIVSAANKKGHRLSYDLESGEFKLRYDRAEDPVEIQPVHFMVDPQFERTESEG